MIKKIIALGLLAGMAFPACAPRVSIRIDPETKITVPRDEKTRTDPSPENQERLQPPDQDQPAQITADRMTYQKTGRLTVFRGNVRVNQEEAWLFTPYLEVRSEDGLALARGGIRLIDHARGLTVTAREMEYKRNFSNVLVRKQVVVLTHDDQGETLRISSRQLEWDADREAARATGDVVMHYQNITATAGAISFEQDKQEMVLRPASGQSEPLPEIFRGMDRIQGEVIILRVKERTYEVQGSARAVILPEAEPQPGTREQKL